MGTLFANEKLLDKYIRLGIEKQIPVMLPGGHNTYLMKDSKRDMAMIRRLGEQAWKGGLPVLDDLHNTSYDWKPAPGLTDKQLQDWRTAKYMETIKELKPGVTMVIMHNTDPTPVFEHISDSGVLRKADMLAMIDPRFQEFLKKEGFVLTTWRELMDRRRKVR
jgi:hypothetical protein